MGDVRFSIVMSAFETFSLFPRALTCVWQQAIENWELIVVIDGESPSDQSAPAHVVRQIRTRFPGKIEVIETPRAEGLWGNRARHEGMLRSTGDYVVWVNHDNLIQPGYLTAHLENIDQQPGCISLVTIDLWHKGKYHGLYPRRIARSHVDLLCMAIPLKLAKEVDAFGPSMEKTYAADWLILDACRKLAPLRTSKKVVGTHF